MRDDLVTALIRSLPRGSADCWCPRRSTRAPWSRSCVNAGSAPATGSSQTSSAGWSGRLAVSPSAPRLGRRQGAVAPAVHFSVEDSPGRSSPWSRPRRTARGGPARASPAGVPRRFVVGAVRPAQVGVRRDPRRGRHDVDGGTPGPGYPALVDDGGTAGTVSLRVLPTRAEAVAEHRLGVRRLLLLNVAPPWKQVLARLTNARRSWPSRTTRTVGSRAPRRLSRLRGRRDR